MVGHPEKCLYLCGNPPGSLVEVFSQMGIRPLVAKLLRKSLISRHLLAIMMLFDTVVFSLSDRKIHFDNRSREIKRM
jgi:hypothetical protein